MVCGRRKPAAARDRRGSIDDVELPKYAKPVAFLLGAVAVLGYLTLIELGVNAGRVHYGVAVEGYPIGGRTFTEAVARLAERGKELERAPVVFATEGFDCRFVPKQIGWGPQPYDTAEAAMSIGRPLRALDKVRERIDAWFGNVEVPWMDNPDAEKVDRLIAECRKKAVALGLSLDEDEFREQIDEAITEWPRQRLIPLPVSAAG